MDAFNTAPASPHSLRVALEPPERARYWSRVLDVSEDELRQVVGEVGPDHEKEFEVMVSVDAYERYGKGRNKKDAEQAAARYLLDHLQG